MVELLKQPQYQPMNVVDQVMSIFAGTEGFLDDVPVRDVQRFEADFLRYMREEKSEVRDLLGRERQLSDEVVSQLTASLNEFKARWQSGAGATPTSAPEAVAAGA